MCFGLATNAQQVFTAYNKGYFSKKYNNSSLFNSYTPFLFLPLNDILTPDRNQINNYGPYVPKVYNYKELAFFCKLEVKMEKNAKLPIKVRLGDVDYVDWLEGKRDQY